MLGIFQPSGDEALFPDRSSEPSTVAIVGNVGSAVWPFFEAARQNSPGLTLDRWTETIVGEIAKKFGIDAVYPFEGPPFHPFIRWAERTGTLFPSPLGLTVHPTFGLWIAFRAALLIDQPLEGDSMPQGNSVSGRHPCNDCMDRPCLTTCPVGAFSAKGYAFETCLDHLAKPVNDCRQAGCLARIACPVGQKHRYEKDHAAFHMEQLLSAHRRS
ncbi:MAG: hypothetical protein ACR2RF_15515 [Geminicoccaceae bacterium]